MKALGHNDVPPPGTSRKRKLNSKSVVVHNQGSCTVTVQTTMLPRK